MVNGRKVLAEVQKNTFGHKGLDDNSDYLVMVRRTKNTEYV